MKDAEHGCVCSKPNGDQEIFCQKAAIGNILRKKKVTDNIEIEVCEKFPNM